MYIVNAFYKHNLVSRAYETESEARSEGMKMDGNVYIREGENGFPVLLKESTFEVGKEYTFLPYGVGNLGVAKLVSLNGNDAVIDVVECDDWELLGNQHGKLTGGSIIVKGGLALYANCPA